MNTEVFKNRAGVVQLVRRGDESYGRGGMSQVSDVCSLPLRPVELRRLEGIRTALDDLRHLLTELRPDFREAKTAAAVLCRIMEQRADSLVYVGTVLGMFSGMCWG